MIASNDEYDLESLEYITANKEQFNQLLKFLHKVTFRCLNTAKGFIFLDSKPAKEA